MADVLTAAPGNFCTSKVTLAEGTTTTLSNTGTILYCINGIAYDKAAMSNAATPTTDYATGAAFIPIPIPGTTTNLPAGVVVSANGYACAFLVGLDSAEALKVIQGPIVPLDTSGVPMFAPTLPSSMGPVGPNSGDNNFCPIGYVVVKASSTAVATWTFGTTDWTTTGITTSLGDLMTLTGRPLTGLTFS